jgi:hypothetical protein
VIQNAPLPVELTSLAAECADADVLVKWTTASEYNSMVYIVENSQNGTEWKEVGSVQAAGNSIQMIDYIFVHEGGAREENYYRIVQIDQDGQFEVFGPVSSHCNQESSYISSYPNPSSNAFSIQFYGLEFEGLTQINLLDQSGRVVFGKQMVIEKNMSSVYLNDVNVTPGIYQVVLIDQNNKSASLKQSIR